jgi:hypothetical protein
MNTRLPNLLLAGVTKAGTTSLFSYLAQHPEICGASLKEPEYFSRLVYPDATLEPPAEYERYFRHCRNERYVLEASANYWYGGPRLLAATEKMLGRPRYIISLRDPVERFWSDFTYMHSKRLLDPDMSVHAFLDRCLELRSTGDDFTETGRRFRTLSTGFYVEFLGDWLAQVGDRSRIVFFEHLTTEPIAVVGALLEWLDLDPAGAERFDYSERNQTINHRSARFQRLAYSGAARVSNSLRHHPRAKDLMAGVYYRLNSAGARDESLNADVRARLGELYADANRQLRKELHAYGYQRFPAWIAEA